ncbi:MAG: hypothetical protein AAFX87_09685 [Bacteroidota bacterium]
MKNSIFSITFLLITFISFGSLAQEVNEELEKRNGFKDIKLMSDVEAYEGLVLKKTEEDQITKEITKEVELFAAKKGFYQSIGSIKVQDLEVKAYKKLVYEIKVITPKNPKLYQGLKKIYGKPKFSGVEKYVWRSTNLQLTFRSLEDNKLELVYTTFLIADTLSQEDEKEIEDIANDF